MMPAAGCRTAKVCFKAVSARSFFMRSLVGVMNRDAGHMRGSRPFLFFNLKAGHGLAEISAFILKTGGFVIPS